MSDLMVPPTGAVSTTAPRGFEELTPDRSDLIIPRAKLLQALSPEVAEGKMDGAKPGLIINSLLLDPVPPRFVPVFCFKSWFRFNPRSANDPGFNPAYAPKAMIWRSLDPKDPRVLSDAVFGPNGEKPLALTCLNFFSHFPGVAMPLVVSFTKTSYSAGKKLLSLARYCGGDMWSRAYQLGAELQTNEKGAYYVLSIKTLGPSSEDERRIGEAWWKEFAKQPAELKLHEDEIVDGAEAETVF